MSAYYLVDAENIIQNIIEWDGVSQYTPPNGWTAVGQLPVGATYAAPPVRVPETISDRQFYQQLALQGAITQAEALAYVRTGALPALLSGAVQALSTDQQFAVQMQIIGSVGYQRNDPTVALLASALGWTDAQLDALWIAAAAL